MQNQSHLFQLEEGIHYLNCAYMSPLLKSVEREGLTEIERRRNPQNLALEDFFGPVATLKSLFSELIGDNDADRIAIIPSASYGLANAAMNVPIKKGGKIILLEGQFPSNYYVWEKLANKNGMHLDIVAKPNADSSWSDAVFDRVNSDTAAVAIAPVHWADGSTFDCKSIGQRCLENEAYFILDGTQAIGARDFDLKDVQVDALICAGYKWLMGPYGFGLAYYGPRFDDGTTFEEGWFSKLKSDEFADLVDYQEAYRPKAWRFNVGESSNFVYVKMMIAALKQIKQWTPHSIQEHSREISASFINRLGEFGFIIDPPENRASHLFGIKPPKQFSWDIFNDIAIKEKVFVSHRGPYLRISPHLYNTEDNFNALEDCLVQSML